MTQSQPSPNIILTGFMGTGKTTVGRLLAERLGREFVDIDDQIVAHFGKSIPEIFAEDGEAAFRVAEAQLCARLGEMAGLVISTGGGALVNPGNRAALAASGTILCLTASTDEILRRLDATQNRPLLPGSADERRARIRDLLHQRRHAYAAIPLQVDTTGRPDGYRASCANGGPNPDQAIQVELRFPATVRFAVVQSDQGYDPMMYVRRDCDGPASEIGCDDDGNGNLNPRIDFDVLNPGVYYVFIDAWGGEGRSVLSIQTSALEVCRSDDDCNGTAGVDGVCAPPQCAADGDLPSDGGVLLVEDGDGACKDVEGVVRDAIEASGRLDDGDD